MNDQEILTKNHPYKNQMAASDELAPSQSEFEAQRKSKNKYYIFFFFLIIIFATTIFLFKKRGAEPSIEESPVVKKNIYWQKQAIELKNPTLCENSEAFFDIDVPISKEYATKYCKMEYAVATGEEKYCYEPNIKTDRLWCLEKIAETFNRPEILSEKTCTNNFPDDNDLFSDCIKRSARTHNNDNICSVLAQKKLWLGEQTCLRYTAMNEKRTDEFSVETMLINLPILLETCSQYKMKANQMACYEALAKKIEITEGWIPNTGVKKIQDYCQNPKEKSLWKICLYNYDVIANTSLFQKQAIKLASVDFEWQREMCEALKWIASGSTTVIGEIRIFADETCELRMHLEHPFSFEF